MLEELERGEDVEKKKIDKVIEKMENQIAELEGSAPEQQIGIMKEELKLLKMRKERSNIIPDSENLIL